MRDGNRALCFARSVGTLRARILHHDRCFDGACSAALFASFVRHSLGPKTEIGFTGLHHRADQLFDEDEFDGDVNVIVDFKYSPSDRVTWWFDHHQSAFLSEADQKHFERDTSGRKFYDPAYQSCTKFIADTLAKDFSFDSSHLSELIRWADLLDGAQYETAHAAVRMESPAIRLNLLIESAEQNMTQEIIPLLETEPIDQIMAKPRYVNAFRKLFERHEQTIDVIRDRAVCRGNVVFFDLVETALRGYNKFVPYYLFPKSVYTVSVLDGGFRAKVSVGSNPWTDGEPVHNLAKLCERYGGGGHPRVGAISYGPNEFERARAVAKEIVGILSEPA